MSETVTKAVETITDKQVAENVMVNVSEQINSVVNNLATKLEAPAEAVQGIAKYGFEKYVEFVAAEAIGSLLLSGLYILTAIIFATFTWKLIQGLKKDQEDEDFTWDDYVPCSKVIISIILPIAAIIMFFGSMSDIQTDIAKVVAPEGAVVKDLVHEVQKRSK